MLVFPRPSLKRVWSRFCSKPLSYGYVLVSDLGFGSLVLKQVNATALEMTVSAKLVTRIGRAAPIDNDAADCHQAMNRERPTTTADDRFRCESNRVVSRVRSTNRFQFAQDPTTSVRDRKHCANEIDGADCPMKQHDKRSHLPRPTPVIAEKPIATRGDASRHLAGGDGLIFQNAEHSSSETLVLLVIRLPAKGIAR